jgi:accessory colonization factor AcfC
MISTALFQLLLNYYVCDYTASVRMMSLDEIQTCTAIYEQVKTEISGLDSTAMDTRIEAYLAWKAWEQANPDLVKIIKQQARDTVDN